MPTPDPFSGYGWHPSNRTIPFTLLRITVGQPLSSPSRPVPLPCFSDSQMALDRSQIYFQQG